MLELFIYLQKTGNNDVTGLVLITTLIFGVSLVFIIVYIMSYNQRKRKHEEEKVHLKQLFQHELIRTELEVREQTMQTIGSDLHDNIGQLLSLTSLTLGSIAVEDQLRTKEKVDAAIELTKNSIREMRQLGKLLQGEQLMSLGLSGAVEQEIQWLEKAGQFHVSCVIEGNFIKDESREQDLIIFRIIQEVLNNIIKHSQSTLIELSLMLTNMVLTLIIKDNGIGFDLKKLYTADDIGMGLKNIQRRTKLLGGEITIESFINEGTVIKIQIPYN